MIPKFVKSWHPATAAFLFTIWPITAAITLVLRTLKVTQRGAIKKALVAIDVYKSDVLFLLAFLMIGIAVCLFLQRRKHAPTLAVVGLTIAGLIISAAETIAFRFYSATGSTLDYNLIAYTLENFSDTWEVVRSEVPNWVFVVLALIVVTYITVPLLFKWGWNRWLYKASEKTSRGWVPVVVGVVGAILFGLSLAPPIEEPSRAFARNASLRVVTSGLRELFASNAVGEAAGFDTRLARVSGKSDTNIVVIVLESTRATATSLHNPELDTTPFLKSLGENSLWVDHAFSIVPHTSKALVAILCGIPPRLHMPITEASKNGIPGRCLAKMLDEVGYATAFFQSATKRFEGRTTLVKNMGYKTFVPDEDMDGKGFDKVNYFGKEDDIMLEPSRKWLQENKGKPKFLTYLTLTPHHDYLAPRRYGRHAYDDNDEFNRYLNTVHYVDNFVKNVVQMFKDEGEYENTIFVIVGDHGEGFGEHGRRQHDNVIWNEGIRVPLMVHKPGAFPGGKKVDKIGNHLDIVPTAAALAGFKLHGEFPGADLATLNEARTLYSHCWYERRCVASITDDDKFIHHFEQRKDEHYDIVADPLEKKNKVDSMSGYESRLAETLKWRSAVNQTYAEHYEERIRKYVSDKEPKIANRLDIKLGDYIEVLGYEITPNKPRRAGQSVKVRTYFKALKPIPAGYKLFMHGASKNKKRKNYDHIPADGFYGLEDWRPGDYITDQYHVRIPKGSRGWFSIKVGVFHPKKGRLKSVDGVDAVELAKVTIEPPKPKVPNAPKPPKSPAPTKTPKLPTPKPDATKPAQ